ncbi:MAG: hypothetical protein ABGW97_02600 [Christiangramia sp.]|uniref:hypothetical protein n=1 Tax=Christiangramia sp. TaxID=1931228 RepID=UPI0032428C30
MKHYLFALFSIFSIISGYSQEVWQDFEFLIGNWQGVENGVAGEGIGYRTYTFELGAHYIMEKNQSTFPKSEKKPRGEVHRDIGIFSYNSNREEVVYRSFNIENFTNIFVLDTAESSAEKLVFVTREIENNPGNWVARLTIEKLSENEFRELFEIAMDGSNFSPFLSNHWYRVQ